MELDDPEDVKIVTLARAARARSRAAEGAAVRDRDGRTYAAATVDLDHLGISALGLAVGMAVSSGATGLEAAAVCSEREPREDDLAAVRDLGGTDVPVISADPTGEPRQVVTT